MILIGKMGKLRRRKSAAIVVFWACGGGVHTRIEPRPPLNTKSKSPAYHQPTPHITIHTTNVDAAETTGHWIAKTFSTSSGGFSARRGCFALCSAV